MKNANKLLCLVLSAFALAGCAATQSSSSDSAEPVVGPQGPKGDTGEQGPKGDAGKDGNTLLTGTGAPSNEDGKDGDSYIDTTTFDFYVKDNGVWSKKGNIKGEDGQDGFDGKDGNTGKDGKDGSSFLSGTVDPTADLGSDGDMYLNTETNDVFKKADGEWTKLGNIKGDKGDKGEDAIPTYANTFLPSLGGYLYSDKGSYEAGEKIQLKAKVEAGYALESVEVGYNGNTYIYDKATGLDGLLTDGLSAKEGGFVFKPIFTQEKANAYTIADAAALATVGEEGDGTYSLTAATYGTQTNGVTLTSKGNFVKLVGKVGEDNTPATTLYLSGKSSFNANYFSLENVNVVLADDYADSTSILEFNNTFAEFKNSTITIGKTVNAALNFKTGNFAIDGVKIESGKDTSDATFLTTAVLFGETADTALARISVTNLTVNNVKFTTYGDYKGSVFKSFYDAPYFSFTIKNSTFGTSETKIGEVWSHFRKQDHISNNDRLGQFTEENYKKMMKTALLEIEGTTFYSALENHEDDTYNPALISFRPMENDSDDDYVRRDVFADILISVKTSTFNGTAITSNNVHYGKVGDVPLTTIYWYSDEWYGADKPTYYNFVYPYGQVDGTDADLTNASSNSSYYPF